MTHTPSDEAVEAALDKWLREPSDWRNWKEATEIRNQFRDALTHAYAVEPPYTAGLLRGAEIVEAGRSGEFQRDAILEAAARRVRAEVAKSQETNYETQAGDEARKQDEAAVDRLIEAAKEAQSYRFWAYSEKADEALARARAEVLRIIRKP